MRSLFLVVLASTALAQSRATFIHTSPVDAPLSQSLTIEGSLVGGTFAKVEARVRNGGTGEFEDFPLELQYGDLYRGTIPASRMVPPGVE